ncbi:MAG: hypothetical protein O9296_05810 [Novosphingobium sp.]|nr:hypothetical protein [Novosphingobium sp.]
MLKKRHEEILAQAAKYENNVLGSQEHRQELSFLNRTVQDFIKSVRLCEFAATRWQEFGECYLLPAYLDDIIEAALAAQLSIENGMLNPARRELRFMLEVAVNIAYVDELRAKDSFADRTAFYRGKGVNKANVDHVSELPLRMLPDNRESFITSTRSAWVKGSNYVHLTKRRVDEKMALRESGIGLGFETTEMIERISADVHEACSLVRRQLA